MERELQPKSFCAVSVRVCARANLLSRQYSLSLLQILLRIYVEKEILRAGQIAKLCEVDITCVDSRQQRPWSMFADGNQSFNFRQAGDRAI